jgi:hypothetical protein
LRRQSGPCTSGVTVCLKPEDQPELKAHHHATGVSAYPVGSNAARYLLIRRLGTGYSFHGRDTLNPIRGAIFPLTGYGINPMRLVLEGGLYTGGVYGSYRLGQDIRGAWDD